MANNAHISLVGTVLSDPTTRQVNTNNVMSMRVAVRTTKKSDDARYANASDIYDVSVWGKAGEYLATRVKAKAKVWVCGDFMLGDVWTDSKGNNHQSMRVNASQVEILSGGNFTTTANNNSAPAAEEEVPF